MKGLMMGVGLLAFAGTAFGDALEQYDSIPEMIHARGDFDESNHTFEMISEEPAAFRLSKPSFSSDSDDVVYYENWRAAIYGVYNTFAHTDLNAVSVNCNAAYFFALPLERFHVLPCNMPLSSHCCFRQQKESIFHEEGL